jgi:hypothetical protein
MINEGQSRLDAHMFRQLYIKQVYENRIHTNGLDNNDDLIGYFEHICIGETCFFVDEISVS